MTIVEDSRWDSHNRRQQTGQLRCLCYKTADRTQQMGQLRQNIANRTQQMGQLRQNTADGTVTLEHSR